MGTTYTDITLTNTWEAESAVRGFMKEADVHKQTLTNVIVDTGAWALVIGDELRKSLGLKIVEYEEAEIAGGKMEHCGNSPELRKPLVCAITEPLTIQWEDRHCCCYAVVLHDEKNVLLGALPLEMMDLMVHPRTEKLIRAHGEKQYYMVK